MNKQKSRKRDKLTSTGAEDKALLESNLSAAPVTVGRGRGQSRLKKVLCLVLCLPMVGKAKNSQTKSSETGRLGASWWSKLFAAVQPPSSIGFLLTSGATIATGWLALLLSERLLTDRTVARLGSVVQRLGQFYGQAAHALGYRQLGVGQPVLELMCFSQGQCESDHKLLKIVTRVA